MQKPKKDKPSAFEVAIDKGDYKLPSEVPTKWTIYDVAKSFIILRRILKYPDDEMIDWMSMWIVYKGDIKMTAIELGMEPGTLYKKIERLDKLYQIKRPLLAGD